MWGRALCLALLFWGCGDNQHTGVPVDAAPDVPDAPLPDGPFFGEPCELSPVPEATKYCRCDDDPYGLCYHPQGLCVDEGPEDGVGVCRPFCDRLHPEWNPEHVCIGPRAGGIVTWTSDGMTPGKPYDCYCRPRSKGSRAKEKAHRFRDEPSAWSWLGQLLGWFLERRNGNTNAWSLSLIQV
jgi:hypothetical protein